MPGSGGHRFEFAGREPLVFRILVGLLIGNTLAMLFLDFAAKYVLPRATASFTACEALTDRGIRYHAPQAVCSYAAHSIAIEFAV